MLPAKTVFDSIKPPAFPFWEPAVCFLSGFFVFLFTGHIPHRFSLRSGDSMFPGGSEG